MSGTIEQKIIETIATTLRIEKDTITPASKIVDDLGADSLDLVEVMMAIEATFGCDIPDDQASKITTVEEAIEYVKKHIN